MTVADNKLSLQNLNRRNLYNFFRREKMWKIIIVVGLGACLIVFAFMVCNSMDSSIPNAIPEPKKSSPTKSQAQKSFAGAKPQTTKTRRRGSRNQNQQNRRFSVKAKHLKLDTLHIAF